MYTRLYVAASYSRFVLVAPACPHRACTRTSHQTLARRHILLSNPGIDTGGTGNANGIWTVSGLSNGSGVFTVRLSTVRHSSDESYSPQRSLQGGFAAKSGPALHGESGSDTSLLSRALSALSALRSPPIFRRHSSDGRPHRTAVQREKARSAAGLIETSSPA
jgi:hypothetical protein